MSLTAALIKKGLLNINDFGVNSTFELSNEDAESVINYYNMSQKVCQRHFIHNDFKAMYYAGKTLMDAEKDIEPFVISTNCHSILCYGAEDGTWEIDDNVFHKRLTIYDPNEPMETHIYIYDDFSNAIYDADKVYILSEQEYMNNDYGFPVTGDASEARIAHFNDKSAYIDATTHPGWDYEYDYDNRAIYVWTRDVHHNAFGFPEPFYVLTDGRVTYGSYTYSNWSLGIQPVLRVKKTSPHVKTSSISF